MNLREISKRDIAIAKSLSEIANRNPDVIRKLVIDNPHGTVARTAIEANLILLLSEQMQRPEVKGE